MNHIYNLKNVENIHGGVLLLVKLQHNLYNLKKCEKHPWRIAIKRLICSFAVYSNPSVVNNTLAYKQDQSSEANTLHLHSPSYDTEPRISAGWIHISIPTDFAIYKQIFDQPTDYQPINFSKLAQCPYTSFFVTSHLLVTSPSPPPLFQLLSGFYLRGIVVVSCMLKVNSKGRRLMCKIWYSLR